MNNKEKEPVAETPMLSVRTIDDAHTLLSWIRSYICQPHPQIGRKGAVCPFAEPAIDNNTLDMVFHYEVDGQSVAEVAAIMQGYIQIFLDRYALDRPDAILQTLLIVFPDIPVERSTVIDEVHQALKSAFVERGLMLGQFHMTCPEPAVRNPDFPVMVSPLPFFAIRHMAQHDVLFLNQRRDWFSEYDVRQGEPYLQGKVSHPLLVQFYEEAKQRFGDQQDTSACPYHQ
jgi:hypothetical protein